MDWPAVPAGAFVVMADQPVLALETHLVPWTVRGYQGAQDRPEAGRVEVITPPSTVAALRAGYRPQLDPSAGPGG